MMGLKNRIIIDAFLRCNNVEKKRTLVHHFETMEWESGFGAWSKEPVSNLAIKVVKSRQW
jgi:hypothetical protein